MTKRVLVLACVAVGLVLGNAARAADELLATPSAHAEEPECVGANAARHDRPPRKVIVGTTMTRWYSDYPGLSGRLEQMRRLIDEMAAESRSRYGRSIDLALFTEYAVTAGKSGTAAEVAVPLDDTIIGALGVQGARAQHLHCIRRRFSRRSGHRRLLERRRRDRPPGTAGWSLRQGPPRAGSGRSRGERSCWKAA